MKRRQLLHLWITALSVAGLRPFAATPATRPFFLHGAVTLLTWADPLPRLELLQRENARRVLREWERHSIGRVSSVGELLAQAIVPTANEGERWAVALPSLARLEVAQVPRPRIGDIVSVLGAWRSRVAGMPALDALVFLRDGRAWVLPPVGSAA